MKMITIDTEKTGKRIQQMCREKGLTVSFIQRELCFKSPQAVYRWFSCKTIPSIDSLVLLANLLDCHIEDLLAYKVIDSS
ncbi:MAG: helix-turn-helix domain-containing protein [Lachnospiraceae bacterium]|nr:helix-turn-helix domain-containing protein [Lachnospiraceae bacterium]